MQVKRNRNRRKTISMTSLIDVIFLLLLFFMLTSTFLRYSNFDVASAGAPGTSKSGPPKTILTIFKDKLTINGEPISEQSLIASLNLRASAGETKAVVFVKQDVDVDRLISVLDLGRSSNLKKLILAQ